MTQSNIITDPQTKLVCSCNLNTQYTIQYTNPSLYIQAKGEKVKKDNMSQKLKVARYMRILRERKPDSGDNIRFQFRLL